MTDRIFGIHGLALAYQSERMGVLSSNIANADTPNFKARDVSFQDALRAAAGPMAGEGGALPLQRTDPRQLSATGGAGTESQLLYRIPDQPALDGNTVDMERERVRFTENAVAYQTTLSFLNSRIKSINSALTGQ
ncbi:flagellar basal body rod protein FlgB [Halothiobacillus sp. DCM-1]|uniref:flagellar basal body rod protein FlgB n=1 Tax=Halothiobacillus sp. DCM-1 TaxID=3112558 RepID=UPI003255C9C6